MVICVGNVHNFVVIVHTQATRLIQISYIVVSLVIIARPFPSSTRLGFQINTLYLKKETNNIYSISFICEIVVSLHKNVQIIQSAMFSSNI